MKLTGGAIMNQDAQQPNLPLIFDSDCQQQQSSKFSNTNIGLGELELMLQFKFDSVLYTEKPEYAQDYRKQIIYYILKVIDKNYNITINQLCSIIRNTLQVPEDMIRTSLNLLLANTESKVIKEFKQNGITHLSLNHGAVNICEELLEAYPFLERYVAPKYERKKSVNSSTESNTISQTHTITSKGVTKVCL